MHLSIKEPSFRHLITLFGVPEKQAAVFNEPWLFNSCDVYSCQRESNRLQIHPDDYPGVEFTYHKVLSSLTGLSCPYCLVNEFRLKVEDSAWTWVELNLVILSVTKEQRVGQVIGILKGIGQSRSCLYPGGADSGGINQKELHITPREQEVLKLIAHGYSAKQIADKLFISIHTAINHRKNLIEKFGVKNTAELILKASRTFVL